MAHMLMCLCDEAKKFKVSGTCETIANFGRVTPEIFYAPTRRGKLRLTRRTILRTLLPLSCKTQFPTYFFSVLAIFRKIAPSASEMSQKTVNVSEARARLYALLDETAASHEPILITGKRANAVLIAEEDWRAIQETLFLLSIPGMRESIREGLATSIEECSTNIEW
jgi:prevent-host-death family protein